MLFCDALAAAIHHTSSRWAGLPDSCAPSCAICGFELSFRRSSSAVASSHFFPARSICARFRRYCSLRGLSWIATLIDSGRGMNAAALEAAPGQACCGPRRSRAPCRPRTPGPESCSRRLGSVSARLGGAKFHQRQIVVCPRYRARRVPALWPVPRLPDRIPFCPCGPRPGRGARSRCPPWGRR